MREFLGAVAYRRTLWRGTANCSIDQLSLTMLYKQQYDSNMPIVMFKDVGFRVYSQHEEDGLLLFVFSLIGTTNKRCVELCAGNGIECNTANLILNHRWIGLLFDGKRSNTQTALNFYRRHPDSKYWPPVISNAWITRTNVNSLIERHGFNGEIDLLSLDVDGVDYWLWDSIHCVNPRVVILEINHLWGPTASVTVPYRDDFIAEFSEYGSDYAGASLAAFIKLGRKKGYRLVGTNAIATNAIFIRNDIECAWLPELAPSACFDHPRAQFGMTYRQANVRDKEWTSV